MTGMGGLDGIACLHVQRDDLPIERSQNLGVGNRMAEVLGVQPGLLQRDLGQRHLVLLDGDLGRLRRGVRLGLHQRKSQARNLNANLGTPHCERVQRLPKLQVVDHGQVGQNLPGGDRIAFGDEDVTHRAAGVEREVGLAHQRDAACELQHDRDVALLHLVGRLDRLDRPGERRRRRRFLRCRAAGGQQEYGSDEGKAICPPQYRIRFRFSFHGNLLMI
ncbi:MAG: hypothetical protein M5R40_19645 [Anaerolineae bacterium]|nr:hypothetical protein [Anaerolineae bacterium]